MFLWSSVFSKEPQVPGQRSPEELVTNMLILELGYLLKRTERLRQERAMENRRRSSSVDYSWLAAPPQKSAYEIPAGEILELQDLCAKVSPSQCGPLILRLRKVVTEAEPEVTEVSRLFRSVLCNFLDEVEEGETKETALKARANRSKSMSVINLHSRLRVNPLWSRVTVSRDAEDQGEEEEEDEDNIHRNRRIRSMPDISVVEERALT
ncbi:RD3-like protein [Labeo rohita]|uniref:RD3-like protein n=2 Tax=Labeo rohita TaxID=84645 RepID=A0A498N5L7_LABRO|nr:protein RD3 [Labeo rohita]KAI2651301.1 Protein RD3 [Labeo rohita]RXN06939.1 RD3-like protein [Labeo rohita]RXN27092.1 RD3-like protein [Labeo rohita]